MCESCVGVAVSVEMPERQVFASSQATPRLLSQHRVRNVDNQDEPCQCQRRRRTASIAPPAAVHRRYRTKYSLWRPMPKHDFPIVNLCEACKIFIYAVGTMESVSTRSILKNKIGLQHYIIVKNTCSELQQFKLEVRKNKNNI